MIRASDGGHVNNGLKLTHGLTKSEHRMFDDGIVYTAAGNIYLAFYQISPKKRDADNLAFSEYAGRMMVGSYSVAGNTMNWVNEQ